MDKQTFEDLEKLPFEQALAKLEEIVDKMESGNLPLDDMIANFEQGNMLSKVCGSKLNSLQKKIEVLVKEDSAGGTWQSFDASSQRQNQASVNTAPQQTSSAPQPASGDELNNSGDNLPF